MATLTFELVTPEKAVLSTTAYMVEIPGSEGDMGVLAGHAPVMTTIRDGEVRVYASASATPQRISVEGGFAEIGDAGVTVLAERATILN
ncbi:MAG: ATP synthase F1 subunit epsilon [Pseudomonadota bacterium]